MDPIHLSSGDQQIVNRTIKFSPDVFCSKDISELLCKCFCNRYCVFSAPTHYYSFPCHDYKLVITDGACFNNGSRTVAPTAGFAAVAGSDTRHRHNGTIDDNVDPGKPRTNQRAELLGALAGIKLLEDLWDDANYMDSGEDYSLVHGAEDLQRWVVATDSEYVVKGITLWYPRWRSRGWLTANGTTPMNLDLFNRLDSKIRELETKGVLIGFWRVPRAYIKEADSLAKAAAEC